jgi:hypothetical protein
MQAIIIDEEMQAIGIDEEMQAISIDEELRAMLPRLDEATYAALEASIVENGCRDALVLWGDVLIDGHNRYEICLKHGIPFRTVSVEFESRDHVLIWIITTQVARRNLTPLLLSYYRGLHYRTEKKLVRNATGKNQHTEIIPEDEVIPQNGAKPQSYGTASRLAEKYNVSHNTISRDAKVSEAIDAIGEKSPETKTKILSGEIRMGKKELSDITAMESDEISSLTTSIEEGTYTKPKREAAAPPGHDADGGLESNKEPVDDDAYSYAAAKEISTAINSMTNDLHAQLQKVKPRGGAQKVRDALTAYIEALELLKQSI